MSSPPQGANDSELIGGSASVELSSNRTSLSFERTRMSADRTLMSIVRTALSLIGFGFTLYQVFNQAVLQGLLRDADTVGRRLGIAMLALGILLLTLGIGSHARFGRALTQRRARLFGMHLLHTEIRYDATPTFVVAILLLCIGIAALASIVVRLLG